MVGLGLVITSAAGLRKQGTIYFDQKPAVINETQA